MVIEDICSLRVSVEKVPALKVGWHCCKAGGEGGFYMLTSVCLSESLQTDLITNESTTYTDRRIPTYVDGVAYVQ